MEEDIDTYQRKINSNHRAPSGWPGILPLVTSDVIRGTETTRCEKIVGDVAMSYKVFKLHLNDKY